MSDTISKSDIIKNTELRKELNSKIELLGIKLPLTIQSLFHFQIRTQSGCALDYFEGTVPNKKELLNSVNNLLSVVESFPTVFDKYQDF